MKNLNVINKIEGLSPIEKIWLKANSVAHSNIDRDRKDLKTCINLVYPNSRHR